jgi:flagellin-like protein
MRKGITPIIAIIILLLITISLAAAAWTFLTGYFTGLTGNVIDISTQTCIGGDTAMGIVKNIGSAGIIIGDITVIDKADGNSATPVWTSVDGATTLTPTDVISPGGNARMEIGSLSAGRYNYAVIVAGREYTFQVLC